MLANRQPRTGRHRQSQPQLRRWPLQQDLTYAALGNQDQAFSWLEKAYAEKSSFMTTLQFWSVFDPIRPTPRFVDLMDRVGLTR
jgi:hypothetical protein